MLRIDVFYGRIEICKAYALQYFNVTPVDCWRINLPQTIYCLEPYVLKTAWIKH